MARKPAKPQGRPELAIDPRSLGGKIRAARKKMGLSTAALAMRVGVKQPSISRTETGETTPDETTLIRLAQELKSDFGRPELSKHAHEPTIREIQLVAYAAGGQPIVEEIQDQAVSVDPATMKLTGDVCALKVKGDSMVEQHILNSDVLICRKVPEPKELRKGTIVVVDLKGERGASVKRWEFKNGTIYLYSDKYAKQEEKMPFHDWEIGKVFEILGLVRSFK